MLPQLFPTRCRGPGRLQDLARFLIRSPEIMSLSILSRRAAAPLFAPRFAVAARRGYHEVVHDHFNNPRNVGSLDKEDKSVGSALVGKASCGDVIKLQVKVGEDGTIQDAKFKTFGCGSAIASSSYATEMIIGQNITEASKITNSDISSHLKLPPVKIHCSVLAEEAIQAAIADYKTKNSSEASALCLIAIWTVAQWQMQVLVCGWRFRALLTRLTLAVRSPEIMSLSILSRRAAAPLFAPRFAVAARRGYHEASCGDVIKLQVKVGEDGTIQDAKFKTFGCGSAIASSSYATEMIIGQNITEASKITNSDISSHLKLPPVKIHCSVLAEEAIQAAIADYKTKNSSEASALCAGDVNVPCSRSLQRLPVSKSPEIMSLSILSRRPAAPLFAPRFAVAARRGYHEVVHDHFNNPRNVGSLDKEDKSVGSALVGKASCGDVIKLQVKVGEDGTIQDAKFKTFGCGSATEMIIGQNITEASKITNSDISSHLKLPPVKIHCSVLAEEAIQAAIADYRTKNSSEASAL
ncbi:ISU1 [Symbiodinium microadriaticum]|nr:ISU1 [Symbiodinium microadriaticum]